MDNLAERNAADAASGIRSRPPAAPRPAPPGSRARRVRAAARVRRLRELVADRLRLPRHALGARPRPARRYADLPGARPRGRRDRQPGRLPTGLHPRRPCRSRSCPRLPRRGSGSSCSQRVSSPRCGSSAFATGAASCSPSRRRSSSTACSSGTSPSCSSCRSRSPGGTATVPGSRGRRRRRGRREAVRLAARRLAAPDAALPGCGLGGRLGCGARARGVGAHRLRGLPRLSEAAAGGAGRVRGAQRLAVDRRGRARRPGVGRRRGRRGRRARLPRASPRGSSGGTTATGARSPSSSSRAFSRRRSSGRTTRPCCSSRSRSRGRGSRRRGSSGTPCGSPKRVLRIASQRLLRLHRAVSWSRPGSGVTPRPRDGSPRRCASSSVRSGWPPGSLAVIARNLEHPNVSRRFAPGVHDRTRRGR